MNTGRKTHLYLKNEFFFKQELPTAIHTGIPASYSFYMKTDNCMQVNKLEDVS